MPRRRSVHVPAQGQKLTIRADMLNFAGGGDYPRSELGRTGMAPCWVQTKAETSTAFLCASRMVFPKSICATKVAVKLSPAPTVSATCTLGVGT